MDEVSTVGIDLYGFRVLCDVFVGGCQHFTPTALRLGNFMRLLQSARYSVPA